MNHRLGIGKGRRIRFAVGIETSVSSERDNLGILGLQRGRDGAADESGGPGYGNLHANVERSASTSGDFWT